MVHFTDYAGRAFMLGSYFSYGSVARTRAFAKKLSDAPLSIIGKRRRGNSVAKVITMTKYVHYP